MLKAIIRTLWPGPKPKPVPPTPPGPTPTPPPGNNLADKLLALCNAERQKASSAPLRLNPILNQVAQKHSDWMAINNRLDHNEGPITFAQRIQAAGYHWAGAGENIGAGYTSPEAMVAGWMNSPGHRANILNPHFNDVGFGMSHNYWTADFATPAGTVTLSGAMYAPQE
jgi:uncharacterized protein YkwD